MSGFEEGKISGMRDETQKGIVSGCQDLRKEGLVEGKNSPGRKD